MESTLRCLAIALLVLATGRARADELRVSVPAWMLRADLAQEQHAELVRVAEREADRGRGVAVTGILLSVVGTVLTITGPVLMTRSWYCDSSCDGYSTAGIAISSIGPITLVAGIPTWAAGESQRARARRARVTLMANGIRF